MTSHFCLDDSPRFQWIELGEVDSTNSFLRGYRPARQTDITLVTTEFQTAGRGQGTNRWEAEAGKNLLFSLQVHPASLPVEQMFVLSEAIALSIQKAVEEVLKGSATASPLRKNEVLVKWPNDVYVGDKKVAGILIENELKGQHIGRSILGCGVNVNQSVFTSEAPNPISLCQLLGHEMERSFLLEAIMTFFTCRYDAIQRGKFAEIHTDYLAALYRRMGFHTYHDVRGTFQAEIINVEPSGHLILQDKIGHLRRYAFKEVTFL